MENISDKTRCQWCLSSEEYIKYHDEVWGIPIHEDNVLFEFLSLEGAQAGLSWISILKRRDDYKRAFKNFDIEKVARLKDDELSQILKNYNIIKNRLKVKSVINNAKLILEIKKDYGTFDSFIWQYVGGSTIQHNHQKMSDIPPHDKLSLKMSQDLKKIGFSFVGPTICYAFMQAVGMVNDHTTDCFRYFEV